MLIVADKSQQESDHTADCGDKMIVYAERERASRQTQLSVTHYNITSRTHVAIHLIDNRFSLSVERRSDTPTVYSVRFRTVQKTVAYHIMVSYSKLLYWPVDSFWLTHRKILERIYILMNYPTSLNFCTDSSKNYTCTGILYLAPLRASTRILTYTETRWSTLRVSDGV